VISTLLPEVLPSSRTKFRRQANAADNRAASTAVDSLINYEAVKVQSHSVPVYFLHIS
jgi:ABC-type transport system involved in Fe-S cluster assembly fused permease/ATPase subunit